jgi:hypothetical protein
MIWLCVHWGLRKSNTAKPPTSVLVSTIRAASQTSVGWKTVALLGLRPRQICQY